MPTRSEDRGFRTPCLIWLGSVDKHGYGKVSRSGGKVKAHREAYERGVGEIAANHNVEHLCGVRLCVAPSHLVARPTSAKPTHTVDAETGCWVWQRSVRKGRGVVAVGGRKRKLAHRWMYERMVGTIPDGHHLHHECENPMCVNPAHLRPLTPEAHTAWHEARRA